MKRLPRKRKKQVKKIVAAKTAFKIATAAMTSSMALAQTAVIVSIPSSYFGPVAIADRAVSVAKVMVDTAQSISKILSEPPNSWREFIR